MKCKEHQDEDFNDGISMQADGPIRFCRRRVKEITGEDFDAKKNH
jgi:hypothetical protein